MNYFNLLLIAFLMFGLMSCEAPESMGEKSSYLDTKEFVNNQIEDWKDAGLKATKTVTISKTAYDLKREILVNPDEIVTGIIVDKDFLKLEMAVFNEADISSISLIDKYEMDTFWAIDPLTLKEIKITSYTSKEYDLKTKTLELGEDNSLLARISQQNFMTQYNKTIYYDPNNRISVQGWQKTIFMDTVFYMTSIDFE